MNTSPLSNPLSAKSRILKRLYFCLLTSMGAMGIFPTFAALGEPIQSPAPPPFPASPANSSPLAPNEIRILTPQTGVTGTQTNLVIQYHPQKVTVTVNGQLLDPKTPTQVDKDENQNLVTQAWYGIPLKQGENIVTAQAANGPPTSVKLTANALTKTQTGQGATDTKVKITIAPVNDPRIPADGRSTITLQGQITNGQDQPIPQDVLVTLTTSAGRFVGTNQDKDQPGFHVLARQGQFTAVLQSGLNAQRVRIRAAIADRQPLTAQVPKAPVIPVDGQDLTPSPQNQPYNSERLEVLNSQTSAVNPAQYPISGYPYPYVLPKVEAFTQVEFFTYLRPSLTTGSISLRIGSAGTDYYGRFQDFLSPNAIGKGAVVDFKASAFATGKVGDWLFTSAYNSYRPLNEDCEGRNRLFGGVQFCEQPYPVYGDSSTFTSTAPSIDSFFLRFERTSPVPGAEADYGMWGDYNTQEFARASQVYTATTRQLHGFKANYNFGDLQVTALYGDNVQAFQRDTIVPNGTSGYYFLSRRLLVPGSENVFLESEEINRPGTVLERKQLYRDSDYEIDYDRGTLLFRRAILSTEFNPFGTTLVRRIVVTYQNEGGGAGNVYAGRVQYNFRGRNDEKTASTTAYSIPTTTPYLGATYLHQNQGTSNFELLGSDFLVPLGHSGQVTGEYAHSTNDSIAFGNVKGSAYRLEAAGELSRGLQSRAYYRSVEENFANDATFSFTPGQTRYGATVAAALGPTTTLQAGYDHEVNFGIAPADRTQFFDLFDPQPQPIPGARVDNSLSTFQAGIAQKLGRSDLSLEYVNRDRSDRVSNEFSSNASQLVSRLNVPLTQALAFRAQNEQNVGGGRDLLYPNRTTLGLDWGVIPGVTVRLAQQFYSSTGLLKGNSLTSLDTVLEHKFSEDTSVTGRYSVISAYNGVSGEGAVGLNQRIRLAPGLRMNLGYERVFNNLFNSTAAGVRFAQPYATSQSASSLGLFSGNSFNVGLEYTDNPDFQASARFEYHNGSDGNNTVISAAASGKITPAITGLLRFQQAGGANQLLEGGLGNTADLRVGLAYRDPHDDRFNGLMSYEYRQNPSSIPDSLLLGSGTAATAQLFSLEGIYAPSWRWEFYGKSALRFGDSYLSQDFHSSSAIYLVQLRTSYKLGYRTDVAVEGRYIDQPSVSYRETGFALEGGYYLTPDLRVGIGYSFGSADDRDFTGYRSRGGPYLQLSFKLNELLGGFGRQQVTPRQQQESEVKPVTQKPGIGPESSRNQLADRLYSSEAAAGKQSQ